MKYFFTLIISLLTFSAFSQEIATPLKDRLIIKTNILGLLAQGPTISLEKIFSNRFSAEFSFVQGQFNDVLLTDHYAYSGFLIRAKKYYFGIDYGDVSPYLGAYVGNLKRSIHTKGESGLLGYPSRDFSANSIRGGASLGLTLITKNTLVFDGLCSLGYGRYLHLDRNDPDSYSNGYLDVQVWFSIGYCF